MAPAAPVLTSSHPLFAVNGADAPGLADDLVRLDVWHPREGLAALEVVFANWGPGTEASPVAGFKHFDGRILGLGREIRVVAGEPGKEEVLFVGVVTALEGHFDEGSAPTILVRAEDKLWRLRMTQRSRIHEESSDGDVASRVARDAGLGVQATAEGPTHRALWQVNLSDLALLRERARSGDAALTLAGDTLRFHPVDHDDDEPVVLSRLDTLLRCVAAADLAHQRTAVHVHGWSVAEKGAIHATAEQRVVDAVSPGGRVGPAVLADIGVDAVQHEHLEMPVDEAEARQIARALLLRRARRFVTARGTAVGDGRLRVGRRVTLLDLGDWFTGTYRLVEVRHTWDLRNGLRTHFLAERVSIGGGT